MNSTLLCLIPKVNHLITITQFRPKTLCNVWYKLIKKTIVNRLQILFLIPERIISDNIVIT